MTPTVNPDEWDPWCEPPAVIPEVDLAVPEPIGVIYGPDDRPLAEVWPDRPPFGFG